jgi:hypothetical protein
MLMVAPTIVPAGLSYWGKRAAARWQREAADALDRFADQDAPHVVPPATTRGVFPISGPAEMSGREKRTMARWHREMANAFDRSADEDAALMDG